MNENKKRTRKESVWARMAFKDHATATTRGPPHAYCEQLIFKRINWRDWHAADDCCACTRRKADEISHCFSESGKILSSFFSTYCVVCCHVGKKGMSNSSETEGLSRKSHKRDFLSVQVISCWLLLLFNSHTQHISELSLRCWTSTDSNLNAGKCLDWALNIFWNVYCHC